MAKERKRLLNEDLVSEVPVNPTNHQYGRNRRLMRNQNEDRFEEVTNSADDQGATTNQGLVNDNNEDYQVENSSFQQQHSAQNSISNANLVIESSNMEHNDGSLSSMASSQHSYNSLPKGNQIHIDQRPDLLKWSPIRRQHVSKQKGCYQDRHMLLLRHLKLLRKAHFLSIQLNFLKIT